MSPLAIDTTENYLTYRVGRDAVCVQGKNEMEWGNRPRMSCEFMKKDGDRCAETGFPANQAHRGVTCDMINTG